MFNIPPPPESYRLWDIAKKRCTAGQATDYDIVRHMRFASWLSKATNTHSEYVILVFPQQLWFRERASLLHLYVHWLYCV